MMFRCNSHFRLITLAIPAILMVILAGCSSQPVSQKTDSSTLPGSDLSGQAEQLLIKASGKNHPEKAEIILQATQQILEYDTGRASSILDQLPYNQLPVRIQAQLALQKARIASITNQNWDVFYWLDRESVITSNDNKITGESHILRALAYSKFGEYQASLDEWLSGLPLVSSIQRQQQQDKFWETLLHVPEKRLQNIYPQLINNELKGWVALALIYQPGSALDQQLTRLQSWKRDWPSHPAIVYLPGNFDSLKNNPMNRATQIAVLLPLSGNLAKAGKSVRDGLLAANYEALNNRENLPELHFYDTSDQDINTLAGEAINNGAEMIIGPLSKSNVRKLQSDIYSRIPVLALNYLDDDNAITQNTRLHFYQFGLSSEDEAHTAAKRAYLDGYRRVLTLIPDTDWGKKTGKAFSETWLNLGGEIADSSDFESKTEFSQLAGKMLHTDQSQSRAKQLGRKLGENLGFQPRRRQDFDVIFIGANPAEARQIKPAFAYQYAGNIPVYSTSSVFSGSTNKNQDQDMNGIRVPVMPWLIPGADTQIEQNIKKIWSQSRGQYGTLYALGADAYRLYPRLHQLISLQGSQVEGLTGLLSITPDGKIHRELLWQVFKNGRLKPLPIPKQKDTIRHDALATSTQQ